MKRRGRLANFVVVIVGLLAIWRSEEKPLRGFQSDREKTRTMEVAIGQER